MTRVPGTRDADGERLRVPSVSLRLHGGRTVRVRPLRQVTASLVVTAAPWRSPRSRSCCAHG